jgi:hypothetical protein
MKAKGSRECPLVMIKSVTTLTLLVRGRVPEKEKLTDKIKQVTK